MSSPIHHAEDVDAELVYAPPWAREGGRRERNQLRPAAALIEAPAEPMWRRGERPFSGDLAMAKLQRQMALSPDAIPEPPFNEPESLWPIALRLLGVAAVAAAVAWLAVSLPQARQTRGEAAPPDAAATPVTVKNETPDPLRSPEAAGLLLQHGLAATAMPAETVALASAPAPPTQALPIPTIAVPSAPEAPPPPPPPAPKTLQLAADEIATLVKRGKDALGSGDLAAARLLLRRAAEAGNADAAMALGATFDPQVIRRMGAIGAEPDAARARQWYQKAVELGSTAAAQPLANLEAAAKQ